MSVELEDELNEADDNGLNRYGQPMEIREEDFILTQIEDSSYFWDLKLLRVVKGKNGLREEFKIDGYGMPLNLAFMKIIHYRMAKKKQVRDLKTYMKDFFEESRKMTFIYNALSKLGIRYGYSKKDKTDSDC